MSDLSSNTSATSLFPPLSAKEVADRGWKGIDVAVISGDAYVDHPSFAAAVITRTLESYGLNVGVIAQPNWQDDGRDFRKYGSPRLFFAVTAGNMDSMVNHYTATGRLRSNDAYTPGGKVGFRPDYALRTYCEKIREFYPETLVVAGGIEGSLRRHTHYDFWSDKLLPPLLAWCPADLIIYGAGELPFRYLVEILREKIGESHSVSRKDRRLLQNMPSAVWHTSSIETINRLTSTPEKAIILPSHKESLSNKRTFMHMFKMIEEENSTVAPRHIIEPVNDGFIIVNPPPALEEMRSYANYAYDLPYRREAHPRYRKRGAIPAFEAVKFSINTHRGCFGGCAFCALAFHQRKFILSRNKRSILNEANTIAGQKNFRGHITDAGGPTANMYQMCSTQESKCMKCRRPSCLFPTPCPLLNRNHEPIIKLYDAIQRCNGIKRLSVGSGIRYDLALIPGANKGKEYLERVIKQHLSGWFKVAPEHTNDETLKLLRKPPQKWFRILGEFYQSIQVGKKRRRMVPYIMAAIPGVSEEDEKNCARKLRRLHCSEPSVQEYTPTPMTLLSVIYYTGIDPHSDKKIPVIRSRNEKNRRKGFYFKR